jgi:hypothetical protein
MTPTMLRIHAVLSRESMRPNGELVKIRAMAAEARTSPGYFSKVLERFTAWGMFASMVIRGRNGGIYLFARTIGDTFERYAREARMNIEARKVMAMARLLRKAPLNVSTYTYEDTEEHTVETFIAAHARQGDTTGAWIRAADAFIESMVGPRRSRGRERGGLATV